MDEVTQAQQRWLADRDAHFERIEQMKQSRPHYPEEEVEADIAEALAAIRAARVEDPGEGEQAG